MITSVHIQNFKSLKNIKLQLKRLNLLMGLNGMGKSSLIQSLLVLRQSRELYNGRLTLNEDYVQIGKGRDAMYQYNQKEALRIILEFANQSIFDWSFDYNSESNILEASVLPRYENLNLYSLFNSNFQYLKAERFAPQTEYPTSYLETINNKQVGLDGRFATHLLNAFGSEKVEAESMFHKNAKSDTLMHQVDAWLGEITPGVKLNTTEIPGTDKVLLDFQFETGLLYTNRFRPQNVGFGLSYVLPIIVSLLSIKNDKLIIIENPEAHIHPRGQVELGRLICLAALNGVQIIIETHSDHIVNGIRVAVKEKIINKAEVGLFYFDKISNNEEQYSKVSPIVIDENGELSEYPKNFLDEWSNQLLKLI